MGVIRTSSSPISGRMRQGGPRERRRGDTLSPLYSVREVAEQLGVHPETIRRHIHEGRLEAVRVGRLLRIPKEALETLLDEQRIRSRTGG
jgi:excisionase family DNA binding protein